jgi:hypothetical protein
MLRVGEDGFECTDTGKRIELARVDDPLLVVRPSVAVVWTPRWRRERVDDDPHVPHVVVCDPGGRDAAVTVVNFVLVARAEGARLSRDRVGTPAAVVVCRDSQLCFVVEIESEVVAVAGDVEHYNAACRVLACERGMPPP